MMKKTLILIGLILFVSPIQSVAQSDVQLCREKINLSLAKEQRLYRSVLYGEPEADEAPIGTVRFDDKGTPWMKKEDNKWSTAEEEESPDGIEVTEKTQSNSEMDSSAELETRKGIFQTRRMLTSELIPYLTQSLRALRCRTEAVCELAKRSVYQENNTPSSIKIQTSGCVERQVMTYPECQFKAKDDTLADASDIYERCDNVVKQMIEREESLLKMAVEYDAAYRSMLQFAGNFDLFMKELQWPFTFTLRQATGLIGQFNRIPCFLSSCDASPLQ